MSLLQFLPWLCLTKLKLTSPYGCGLPRTTIPVILIQTAQMPDLGVWLNILNLSPSMNKELSDDLLNCREMKCITGERRDSDDRQVLVSWPRPSWCHRANHHGPIGDVLDVPPPRLEWGGISALVGHVGMSLSNGRRLVGQWRLEGSVRVGFS